jgi:hypothetical protein
LVISASSPLIQERTGRPNPPTARGLTFYRQADNVFAWAVLGVNSLRSTVGDFQFDFAGASTALIHEIRKIATNWPQPAIREVADNSKWNGVYDVDSNTLGIVVDGTSAGISALQWVQFQDYLEQYFKSKGTGFATEITNNVLGLLDGGIFKSRDLVDDLCTTGDYDLASLFEQQVPKLPTGSTAC